MEHNFYTSLRIVFYHLDDAILFHVTKTIKSLRLCFWLANANGMIPQTSCTDANSRAGGGWGFGQRGLTDGMSGCLTRKAKKVKEQMSMGPKSEHIHIHQLLHRRLINLASSLLPWLFKIMIEFHKTKIRLVRYAAKYL